MHTNIELKRSLNNRKREAMPIFLTENQKTTREAASHQEQEELAGEQPCTRSAPGHTQLEPGPVDRGTCQASSAGRRPVQLRHHSPQLLEAGSQGSGPSAEEGNQGSRRQDTARQ